MKVIFIDPIKITAGRTRASRVSVPDVALGYLTACLKADGHEARVIDTSVEAVTFGDIESAVAEFEPDVVAMPLFTYKVPGAMEIARRVRKSRPGARIVVGGAHATALSERTMRECPEFDYAVVGEGEETLRELVSALEEGGDDFSEIRGLVWRRGDEIARNGNRAWIDNLDALPFPDWGSFPLEKYFPMYSNRKFLELPVSSSRGCSGRCSFCFRLSGASTRRRSATGVMEELVVDMEKFGAKSVMFVDEAFTSDRERTGGLCDKMIENGIPGRLRWICQTRINMVDKQLLLHMKEAGCTHLSCGIESGSQEILDSNTKGVDLAAAREAIQWAKDAGLMVDTNYILGLPYETSATMARTRNFPLSTSADFASFFIFTPYPGTPAHKLAKEGKGNLRLVSEEWAKYEIQTGGAVELEGLPRKKLERFQLLCYLSFYLRPSKWRNLFTMIGIKTIPSILLRMVGGKW